MPLFLMKIKRELTWSREEYAAWLAPDSVPADVAQDFRVKGGKLSVWHIEDDRSNLDQVVTALAANQSGLDPIDYGLFRQGLIADCGIQVVPTLGDTPMPNANGWHRDMVNLTVDSLSTVCKAIFDTIETDRREEDEVSELISGAVQLQEISSQALNRGIKRKLGL